MPLLRIRPPAVPREVRHHWPQRAVYGGQVHLSDRHLAVECVDGAGNGERASPYVLVEAAGDNHAEGWLGLDYRENPPSFFARVA